MRQVLYSAKKQLHKGEQNVTKWNSLALSVPFEENRLSNKINRRKKLEKDSIWAKCVILPKNNSKEGNTMLQDETA